jgi:hypothetical protein
MEKEEVGFQTKEKANVVYVCLENCISCEDGAVVARFAVEYPDLPNISLKVGFKV